MANIAKITDSYSVSSQPTVDDFAQIAADGFKTVINFRPDGEKPGYLDAHAAEELAKANNLSYYHIPVPVNGLTHGHIVELKKILSDTDQPVLAHCGTGKRASIVWAFANATDGDIDDIVGCCAKAGHDISPLRPQLQQMQS